MTRKMRYLGSALMVISMSHVACAQQQQQEPQQVQERQRAVADRVETQEVRPVSGKAVGGGFGSSSGSPFIAVQTKDGDSAATKRMMLRLGGMRKMEKGTYLGIAATPVSPAMRAQLTLQPGVGLVVERVDKDSPADGAGVMQYDILQQFNDQVIVNPQQLGVLVRLAKPGDEVSLKILRKGEVKTVTAKLVEKEVPPIDEEASTWGFPRQFKGDWDSDLNRTFEAAVTDASMKKALEIMNKNKEGSAAVSYADKDMKLEVTQKDGDRKLTAKDGSGKVLYEGPINTPEQKAKVPANVMEKLKAIGGEK